MFQKLSRPNILPNPKMCLDESMLLLCCLDTHLLPIRVQIALSNLVNLVASYWTQKSQKLSFHWPMTSAVECMARLETLHCLHWPRHTVLMPCGCPLLSPLWGRICAVLPLVVPLCAVLPLVVSHAVLPLPLVVLLQRDGLDP